jgi:3-deoxy-D-manno-octulosonate 8-phosphate phosphatase (KDO 8-P phosphatase)
MIELVVLDVDGCLTDGKIIYTEKGDEVKAFNVKDGLAIKSWLRLGKEVAIITGRKSQIVSRRAEELGIRHLYQGADNKAAVLEALAARLGIGFENIAAIGDDLNDYKMLRLCGMAFVPNNASPYVKSIAQHVLSRNGGDAVVREMMEFLFKVNNLEDAFLEMWQ